MDEPLVSVAGLHALVYCERLFFLEEVERIRLANARVYAGRRLHVEIGADDDEGVLDRLALESKALGICGSIDFLRRTDGQIIPYEHKRGRAVVRGRVREAWDTDRVQIGAYGLLAEEAFGQSIAEGRVRYHADRVTVRVPIDASLRTKVRDSVAKARSIRTTIDRPPITPDENRCRTCSLAPVCLPEEARLAADPKFRPIRLLPVHQNGQTVHVLAPAARVGRSQERLVIEDRDGGKERIPIAAVASVVVHGMAQITTQAIRFCADHDVQVHWVTLGGGLVGSLAATAPTAQRHLRQFRALDNEETAFGLALRLVRARMESQIRFLLRATRGQSSRERIAAHLARARSTLKRLPRAKARAALLGYEGSSAAAYFAALSQLILNGIDPRFFPTTRSRRPPRDRFNALLSYGYGTLYREVLNAIIAVGLHPGVGFYHRLRSSAHPLALDIMELFRVALVDMPVIAAINRRTFDAESDFVEVAAGVLLSEPGRAKLIEILERRLSDVWRHNVVGYSLSYARIIELEVRLLEKEWTGEPGLFGRVRLR